MLYTA